MGKYDHEIEDEQIRIISGKKITPESPVHRRRHRTWVYLVIGALLAVLIAIAVMLLTAGDDADPGDGGQLQVTVTPASDSDNRPAEEPAAYVEMCDTVVNGRGLLVMTPVGAKPELCTGNSGLDDNDIILSATAADIRADNGGIVGAFVLHGELLSKGLSKAGFCAVINGRLTVGVSDSTPLFEEAIDQNGDFFRQYPLVVAGQLVENKLKGRSIRKALIERDGVISVAVSRERMSLHDFAQTLIDYGVSNAIYLVGGDSPGYAVSADGTRVEFGDNTGPCSENHSFIVWR